MIFFRRHALFLLMLLLWFLAHLYLLQRKSFWLDECYSLLAAAGRTGELQRFLSSAPLVETNAEEIISYLEPASAGDFFRNLSSADIHPPLFFFLLRLWMMSGARSVFWLSVLPLLISSLSLVFLYRLGLEFIRGPYSLLVPGVWMLSLSAWTQDAEVRQYSLLLLICLAAMYLMLRFAMNPHLVARRKFAWLWAVLLALGMLTHYIFAFLVLALDLFALTRKELRTRVCFYRLLEAHLLAGVLLAPWLPFALQQFHAQVERGAADLTLPAALYRLLEVLIHIVVSPYSLLSPAVLIVCGLLLLGIWRAAFAGFRTLFALVAIFCLLLPVFLLWMDLLRIPHMFRVHYFLPAVPLMLLAVAQGISALPRPALRGAAVLFLLVYMILLFHGYLTYELSWAAGSSPGRNSQLPVLLRFLEKTLPEDFVIVVDSRLSARLVEIAYPLPRQRSLLIGDCSSLPSSMKGWARGYNPSVIYLLHFGGLRPVPYADCFQPIAAGLSDTYHVPNPPGEIIAYSGIYLVRRDFVLKK